MLRGCPTCKSRKKVYGLGMMLQDCSTCKGVGFVEEEEDFLGEAASLLPVGECRTPVLEYISITAPLLPVGELPVGEVVEPIMVEAEIAHLDFEPVGKRRPGRPKVKR